MNHDEPSPEAELRELQACSLDDNFLARLESAAEGSITHLTLDEQRFETMLRGFSPAQLPSGMLATLESVVQGVPYPKTEKIVLFPKSGPAPARRAGSAWAAAAAVALIGAATALLVPTGNLPSNTAQRGGDTNLPIRGAESTNLVPAGFDRGLSEVREEGVVWKANNAPQSVLRVVYQDKITLKDGNGRTFQVEQPRVQYMLVPAKSD